LQVVLGAVCNHVAVGGLDARTGRVSAIGLRVALRNGLDGLDV